MIFTPLKIANAVFRALLPPVLLAAVGLAVWFAMEAFYPLLALRQQLREKEQRIVAMTEELAEKSREIQRLDTAMKLLKVDHRVAQIAVLDQWTRPDNVLMTKLAFAEVDDHGNLLDGYKTFTIEGDVVYVDSWVAKFMDEHVENGVPLRSTSICLFRRLFGEHQRPHDGFALDAVGSRPAAYSRGSELTSFEKAIWENFWQYANNPQQAQQVGLRALQGEAPSIRLVAGKAYWIFLRASDGLTIRTSEAPVRSPARSPQDPVQPTADHAEAPR